MDEETGADVTGTGGEGELRVKGPSVFTEYFDNPEATAKVCRKPSPVLSRIYTIDVLMCLTVSPFPPSPGISPSMASRLTPRVSF